ncbi:hypothetical protein LOTGIDRAFT_165579 [Lottia gigantea]|uniref:NTR domain-containing protein n=1 Tax=Lottia gigantea TaxID=225164 RepID=V3ZBQ1_LOTGI|nr:hypothetical protein LOTGIDRAFT_165579 [Lottia gigantea]ESO88453.1 hypothetical protein LOTGIDRAFT_165579 [Lottia gigantea]
MRYYNSTIFLQVKKTMNVKVRFEHDEGRLFFVMVVSKGRIIWTDNFYSDDSGVKIVHIPDKYRDDLSPFARVIVYYHGQYLNADSLTIDFPDKCLDQLQILHYRPGITGLPSTPDDKRKVIRLKGSVGMTVGLVAVDKSVYYLNDKISLTKESLRKEMLKRDTGIKTVQSENGIEIFRINGLLVLQNIDLLGDDIGRPLNRIGDRVYVSPHNNDLIPYKKIRSFFPETFMFEDVVLNSRGTYKHKFLLPDTVTTWIIHAVGISASRGLCVADPIQFYAFLRFHTKLQLPHKVVRLEQVKVKLSVYNYDASTKFKVNITGDLGLCFPRWEAYCGSIRKVKKNGISTCEFDIIPFRTGDLAIRVGIWDQSVTPPELVDAVEKKLYVVPEGKRLRKTITFALDPEGSKLQSVAAEKIVLDSDPVMDNDTLNNTNENIQQTEVDLALPTEIIPGTESCGIQACGDLMGDVISTVIFDTGDTFVSSFYGGEEIIGNLAPIVYALEYLNSLDLLNNDIFDRSRRSITKGVTQLMKYRKKYGSFSLNEGSLPSTWFTALVLKTLCHTKNIKFIDDRLINDGFMWILDQVDEEGRPKEVEFRLSQKNKNYTVMLAAEILIAQKECNKSQELEQEMLEFKLAVFLEENIYSIKSPLVLSKMAYALQLADSPESERVINKFINAAQTAEGLTYWSDNGAEEGVPLWYKQGADSYSIETTAYGLLLYLNNPNLDPNPLADWLIRKRNRNGGFVGPTDTSIAIQALAKFSHLKHSKTTDLHMEISSDISTNYNEVLNFNTENAIQQKEVSNVPVGEKISIMTKGKGLGQMKVRVAYNVPTTPNDHCMFDLTVERKETIFPKQRYNKHYRGASYSGPTNVEIEMLSGYKPIDEDLAIINELSGNSIKNTKYKDGLLTVYLSEVSNNASTCLYLRVKEDEIIDYLQPAPVVVFQPSRPEEICLKNYDIGHLHQTLPVYCIEDDNMKYKGKCQCLSESCGGCKKVRLFNLQKKFCASDVVYNITIDRTVKSEASKDITAVLNKIHKQGDHDIADGKSIELRTSLACSCPNFKTGEPLVLVGKNPKRFVNRNMEVLYRYIVDETTTLVNVTDRGGRNSHGRTNFLSAFHKHHTLCPVE